MNKKSQDIIEEEDYENKKEKIVKAIIFIASFTGLTILSFIIAMLVDKYMKKWKSFAFFINGKQNFSFTSLFLGMLSAIVFAFVDNAGMFLGVNSLESFLPGGDLIKAGWGNIISSVYGAFLSNSVLHIIRATTRFHEGPMYADALGMLIGGVLGIYIPSLITEKD